MGRTTKGCVLSFSLDAEETRKTPRHLQMFMSYFKFLFQAVKAYFRLWYEMSSQGRGKGESRLPLHAATSFTCLTRAGGLISYPQGWLRPSDTIKLSFLIWNELQSEWGLSLAATVSTCWTLTLPAPDSPALLSALHSLPTPTPQSLPNQHLQL